MTNNNIAIRVKNLGKKYTIGGPQEKYLTLRDAIVNSVKAPFKRINPALPADDFWALKDISFKVKQGEVVGIIGRNGAGKSTLLKILSRITTPTEGVAEIHGRVGSLLEVGTGFHPEMTGRENIFLNGSILGMKNVEIEQKFDEIVKFAEIDKFIDTPVKRYSSGMYIRLAFAVAAHLEPEIMVVDEVLAVGDTEFQKKCLGKMGEVAKEGRTVLFVSHNMAAVQQLCNRGIVLDRGKIDFIGNESDAIHYYVQGIKSVQKNELLDRSDRKGSQWLKFYKVGFFDDSGKEIKRVLSGQDIFIRFYYTSEKKLNPASVNIAFNVKSNSGYLLTNLNSVDTEESIMNINHKGYFECRWSKFNLRSGTYDCALFCSVNGDIVDWIQSAFSIDVEDGNFYGSGKIISRDQGDVLISYEWSSFTEE
jgi:lipopolysaccharide transport system ATP-binding protein